MFGVLKKIFGKSESEVPVSSVPLLPETKPRFGTAASKRPAGTPKLPKAPTPEPSSTALHASRSFGADTLNLPYAAILRQIPQELWGRLAPAGVAGLEFPVARQQVLAQLTHGVIKVTFGELRQGVPKGVFTDSDAHDHELVPLPLAEILAQLHPDAYARRANQTTPEVPTELNDLFGPKGERLSAVRVAEKSQPAKPPGTAPRPAKGVSTPAVAASTTPVAFVPPASAAFKPGAVSAVRPETHSPSPSPVSSPIPSAATAAASGTAPLAEEPIDAKTISFPGTKSAPTLVPTAQQSAATKPPLSPVTKPVIPPAKFTAPLPKIAPLPQAAATPAVARLPGAPPAPVLPADSGTLLVAMADLADEWPANIRQEIAQLQTPNPQVALPLAELGQALKRGRVQYNWKQLRAWITPSQFFDVPSPHGETALDLPTKILTPLYIDKTHGTSFFKKQSYADKIPDILAKAEPPVAVKSVVQAPVAGPIEAVPARPVVALVDPASAPPSAAVRPPAVDALAVKLAAVCADWPESVRHEITTLGLDDGQLEIPFAILDRDLKQGRLAYPWNNILSWLNPPAPDVHTSPNGETVLELPLHQVAPLFIQQRPQPARKKSGAPASIPDLFSSTSQAETPAPEPSEPLPAPVAPVVEAPAAAFEPVAVPPPKPPATLAELFGQPNKQNWSPNELVQRTAGLPGLAGALIALQDGFPVAASLPSAWKTETISAFLPQIFGRMSQYCREIGIGETKNVTFSVEEGTFQIFKAGIIYLAILAQPGATIPEAAVELIARELSRHTK